jgi:hypothetical protein
MMIGMMRVVVLEMSRTVIFSYRTTVTTYFYEV